MSKSEQEIHNLFDEHCKTLLHHKKKLAKKITKWRNKLIDQIENHVVEQNNLLNQLFENTQHQIELERKNVLTHAASRHKKNNQENINRLITSCKALKFHLAQFHQYEKSIEYIEIITDNRLASEQQEDIKLPKTQENRLLRRTTRVEPKEASYITSSTDQTSLMKLRSSSSQKEK